MRARAPVLATVVLLGTGSATAGGIDADDPSPRSIGRAGATLVSDDGEGALMFSPASLARRVETRLRLGLAFRDRDVDFDPADAGLGVNDRSGPTLSPSLAFITSMGPLVFGAAYLEPRAFEMRMPAPSFGQPADDVIRLFPHRYAGLDFVARTRELRVGAATRIGDWLAVGGTLSARRVELSELRTIWPGFSGIDGLANPIRDLQLTLEGSESVAAGGGLGVLVAPAWSPIEVTLAVSGQQGATIEGDAIPAATGPLTPGTLGGLGQATLRLPDQLLISSGARFEGPRFAVELGVIYRIFAGDAVPQSWSIEGLRVRDASGVEAPLDELPSQLAQRDHASVQGALEVAILPEFLWVTSGYRYQSRATPSTYLTPTSADLGSHTLAFGAEVYVKGITATIGYSRSFIEDESRAGGSTMLVNPFDGGTQVVGQGSYDRADDVVGISLETTWGDPGLDLELPDLDI